MAQPSGRAGTGQVQFGLVIAVRLGTGVYPVIAPSLAEIGNRL
jgi:hypothetical protein